jgi:hypothetical protein
MIASAWKKYGRSEEDTDCCFGLYIHNPNQNRREYFEGYQTAEVVIDGQTWIFSLVQRKNFWTTCPELRDEDTTGTPIRDWLQRHESLVWQKYRPPHVELTALGNGRFRLRSLRSATQS